MIKKPRLLNIKDKIIISSSKFCPPHYFPHKLPLGKKVICEECHLHKASWRMAHHKFFCKFLGCPHYKFMTKEGGKLKKLFLKFKIDH